MRKVLSASVILLFSVITCFGNNPLSRLQSRFVDLRFGMFVHFNMPTYVDEDWPDPDASPSLFNPEKLNCHQWAAAAKSAGMTYGCLTTKHHSGFCIWDTETTDYSVMSSPLKRDVVKEFTDAFREEGLDVMLYFSILDTHAHLRPGWITPEHKEMVKNQLRELLTNYGRITALIIDGWDAPWSRILYDDIPFEEIYTLIKSIQPDCLIMDLNAAKYPTDALFYTDIKSYEQGAGQKIDKSSNTLPALSCYPIQKNWFWKTSFPDAQVKDPATLVNDNIVPMGKANCNFILNVAPNRDGLMDDNAIQALKHIGKLWRKAEPGAAEKAAKAISPDYSMNATRFSETPLPITASNLAKGCRAESTWSYDMEISDFVNDDDFSTAWVANAKFEGEPWIEVFLNKEQSVNMVTMTEELDSEIRKYRVSYRQNGSWKELATIHTESSASAGSASTSILSTADSADNAANVTGNVVPAKASPANAVCTDDNTTKLTITKNGRVSILRFRDIYADAIRITILESRKTTAPDGVYNSGSTVAISELGVYRER